MQDMYILAITESLLLYNLLNYISDSTNKMAQCIAGQRSRARKLIRHEARLDGAGRSRRNVHSTAAYYNLIRFLVRRSGKKVLVRLTNSFVLGRLHLMLHF